MTAAPLCDSAPPHESFANDNRFGIVIRLDDSITKILCKDTCETVVVTADGCVGQDNCQSFAGVEGGLTFTGGGNEGGGGAGSGQSVETVTVTATRIHPSLFQRVLAQIDIADALADLEKQLNAFANTFKNAFDKPCPSGKRVSAGLGGSATGFLGVIGLSGGMDANISLPASSLAQGSLRGIQVSVSGSLTPLAGLGLFGGIGPDYSAGGSETSRTGVSGSHNVTIQFGVGDGEGVEVVGNFSWPPIFSGAMGRIAAGAYGAVGYKFSGTLASPPIGCR